MWRIIFLHEPAGASNSPFLFVLIHFLISGKCLLRYTAVLGLIDACPWSAVIINRVLFNFPFNLLRKSCPIAEKKESISVVNCGESGPYLWAILSMLSKYAKW